MNLGGMQLTFTDANVMQTYKIAKPLMQYFKVFSV